MTSIMNTSMHRREEEKGRKCIVDWRGKGMELSAHGTIHGDLQNHLPIRVDIFIYLARETCETN